MMTTFVTAGCALALSVGLLAAAESTGSTPAQVSSIYDFTVKDIDGADVALSKYKGEVLLIVNVASK